MTVRISDVVLILELPVILALVYTIASLPVFAVADTPPNDRPSRLAALDGLRGILALFVVMYHLANVRSLIATGSWGTSLAIYRQLGPMAVSVFFMITGFLFFSVILKQGGRPNWLNLYIGRFFRIAPVYLLAVLIVFATVWWRMDGRIVVAPLHLLEECASWLSLGVGDPVDIDGLAGTWRIDAGVIWSLRYEWLFYASLPLLAVLGRVPLRSSTTVAMCFAGCIVWACFSSSRAFPPVAAVACSLFLAGMFCTTIETGTRRPLSSRRASALAISCVAAALMFRVTYAPVPVILLGLFFFLVSRGCDLHGFLTCRVAKRVGDVSYPIYLLHGIVLFGLAHCGPVSIWFSRSPVGFLCCSIVAAILILTLASIAHVLVERPGIAVGRSCTSWLRHRIGLGDPTRAAV